MLGKKLNWGVIALGLIETVCQADYACDPMRNGTSERKMYCGFSTERGKQTKTLVFEKKGVLVAHAYNKKSRLACLEMIILDELPFWHVEGIGSRWFMREVQSKFDPPSRRTII